MKQASDGASGWYATVNASGAGSLVGSSGMATHCIVHGLGRWLLYEYATGWCQIETMPAHLTPQEIRAKATEIVMERIVREALGR